MEHLSQKQVEDYFRHQLGAAELLTASDHLAECEACRVRVEGAMNGEAPPAAGVPAASDAPPAPAPEGIADMLEALKSRREDGR